MSRTDSTVKMSTHFVLYLLASTVITSCITAIIAKQTYPAVSPLTDSEEFYFESKRLLDQSSKQPKEEPNEIKEEICAALLSSTLFYDTYGVSFLDPNEERIKNYLRNNHSSLYQRHYKCSNGSRSAGRAKFLNPYQRLEICVLGKHLQEFVFTCLAKNHLSNEIVEYFVTREYEINPWIKLERVKFNTTARFIFGHEKKAKGITLLAVAEEPAYILGPNHSVEWQSKFNKSVPFLAQDETICDLKSAQRIRMCNVVLTSEEFRHEVRYSPAENDAAPSCEKQNFTSLFYPRLMIPAIECKARNVLTQSSVMRSFYISFGVGRYHFILFQKQRPLFVHTRSFYSHIVSYNY